LRKVVFDGDGRLAVIGEKCFSDCGEIEWVPSKEYVLGKMRETQLDLAKKRGEQGG
jgi:hypothetical protein